MKKKWVYIFGLAAFMNSVTACVVTVSGAPTVSDLRTEFLTEPLCVDCAEPRLSWKIVDSRPGASQTGYHILAASTQQQLDRNEGDLWDSDPVADNGSQRVAYKGIPLASRQKVFWKVRYADQNGNWSSWSKPSFWQMGLLKPEDWKAVWVRVPMQTPVDNTLTRFWIDRSRVDVPSWNTNLVNRQAKGLAELKSLCPAPRLRREFDLPFIPRNATMSWSALGFADVYINGQRVTEDRFNPAEAYNPEQAHYVVYDVAPLLRQGRNVIAVQMANGRYVHRPRGWHWAPDYASIMGDDSLALLFQLEAASADGRAFQVGTDSQWLTGSGPILKSSWALGECFDGTLAGNEWMEQEFDSTGWLAVEAENPPRVKRIIPQLIVPERTVERVDPVSVREVQPGIWVADFGRDLVGSAAVRMELEPEQIIALRYSETVWDESYKQYQSEGYDVGNLRPAYPVPEKRVDGMLSLKWRAGLFQGTMLTFCDALRAGPDGFIHWNNQFSYRSFRYVEILGLKHPPQPGELYADVIHTDLQTTYRVQSSEPLLAEFLKASERTILYNTHAGPFDNVNAERGYFMAGFGLNTLAYGYLFDSAPIVAHTLRSFTAKAPAGITVTANGMRFTPFSKGDEAMYIAHSELFGYVQASRDYYLTSGDRRMAQSFLPYSDAYVRFFSEDNATASDGGLIPYDKWADHNDFATLNIYGQHKFDEARAASPYNREEQSPWLKYVHNTPEEFQGNGQFIYWTGELAEYAEALGHGDAAERYRQISRRFSGLLREKFYDDDLKTFSPGAVSTMGSNLLGLIGNVCQGDAETSAVHDSLIREIKHWGHLTTGLRNTPLLLGYLAECGDIDLAYQLFIRRDPPGLAANLKIGCGTFGETWASGEHPGVGSACQIECINAVPMFIPAYLAGIRPLLEYPGWKRFMIAPCIPAALNDLDFSFESPYGPIRSAWRRESGEIRLDVTVPPNASCDLYIPQTDASRIRFEGGPAPEPRRAGRTLYHLQAGQWSVIWPEASDAD